MIDPSDKDSEDNRRDVWQLDETSDALLERAGQSLEEVLRLRTKKTLVNDEVLFLNADFDGDHVSVVQEPAQTVSMAMLLLGCRPTHLSLSLEGLAIVPGVVILMVVVRTL